MDAQDVEDVLRVGEISVEGRLVDASNTTLFCTAELDGTSVPCVYKPRRGERPLWDFPTGTLGNREVAAYVVSAALGWDLVPRTVWRDDGPVGAGMCQAWVEVDGSASAVDVVPRGRVPQGWRDVIDAFGAEGEPVSLVHADTRPLRHLALFDAVVNNADRKGGHVLVTPDGEMFGIDHGVCFNEDDKLRTVLWGWAGEPIDGEALDALARLRTALDEYLGQRLSQHLANSELASTSQRIDRLLDEGVYPYPGHGWPPLPWPAF